MHQPGGGPPAAAGSRGGSMLFGGSRATAAGGFVKVDFVASRDEVDGTGLFSKPYTLYEFRVYSDDGASWVIRKRFSEFDTLTQQLVEAGAPGVANLSRLLPGKKAKVKFRKDDRRTVTERTEGLLMFMHVIVGQFGHLQQVASFLQAPAARAPSSSSSGPARSVARSTTGSTTAAAADAHTEAPDAGAGAGTGAGVAPPSEGVPPGAPRTELEAKDRMLLSGEGWCEPGAEFDDGMRLIGCRVYVVLSAAEGKAGTVRGFNKNKIRASSHTIDFDGQQQEVRLRRKGNTEKYWLVSQAEKDRAVEEWTEAMRQKALGDQIVMATAQLKRCLDDPAHDLREAIVSAEQGGLVEAGEILAARRRLDEREAREAQALMDLDRAFVSASTEHGSASQEMLRALDRARQAGMVGDSALAEKEREMRAQQAEEQRARRELQEAMGVGTPAQRRQAIVDADRSLVDPGSLRAAEQEVEEHERRERQRLQQLRQQLTHATTVDAAEQFIAAVTASGINDPDLLAAGRAKLEQAHRNAEAKKKRAAARERAQKDLAKFIGKPSGLRCEECGAHKMHAEFFQGPLTQRCNHLQLRCLRCLSKRLARKLVCPHRDSRTHCECTAVVSEDEQCQVNDRLEMLYPAITGPEASSSGALVHTSSGRETIVVQGLMGETVNVPFRAGMLIKDIKEFLEAQIGVDKMQQRLMFKGTELKAVNQETRGFNPVPDGLQAGAVLHLIVGLFANSGGAARIGFAVDVSGSMGIDVSGGHTRMSVVNQHLERALLAHEGAGNAFGIATFGAESSSEGVATNFTLPLGKKALPATAANIQRGVETAQSLTAHGGNGGERRCLEALLAMNLDVVFFLGDGGWPGEDLIAAARRCEGVKINSIAFYTTGGGLEEIAEITGGQWRQVDSIDDFHVDNETGGAANW
jgi:hypothetical protein